MIGQCNISEEKYCFQIEEGSVTLWFVQSDQGKLLVVSSFEVEGSAANQRQIELNEQPNKFHVNLWEVYNKWFETTLAFLLQLSKQLIKNQIY